MSNYLATKLGNCVSMPALFVIIGRKIGIDVTLSLAPEHMFVKFRDESGVYINAAQNEVKYELTLEQVPKKALHYKVSGKFQGKKVEAVLVASEPLRDGRGQAALVAKSLLAPGATRLALTYPDYAPGLDPKSLTSVTIHKPDPAKGADAPYEIEAGPARLKGQFDEHGHMKQSLLELGNIDFLMERIFVEGNPDGAADGKPRAPITATPAK